MIKQYTLLLIAISLLAPGCSVPQYHAQNVVPQTAVVAEQDGAQLYGELFKRVQLAAVFPDSKYFVDMDPQQNPAAIMSAFAQQDPRTRSELRTFVEQYFLPPANPASNFNSQSGEPIALHIKKLWTLLTRAPDEHTKPASSLIALPYPYVVPGGRFREIYYWDSYFTQLGLLADHEDELFKNMVKNFEYLLLTTKKIPNGNRDYYRSRSQPPFFSHMVALWQSRFGDKSAIQFIPALKLEHAFWMQGASDLKVRAAQARVVRLVGGYLNRYWDDIAAPRPEAYKEDVALANRAIDLLSRSAPDVYRDLRAGAESGWDYSTRWFADPEEFATLHTTDLLAVDLNALLYHLELKLAELLRLAGDVASSAHYGDLAQQRLQLMHQYFWHAPSGTFRDYNWRTGTISPQVTVAMVVPLFVGAATREQAKHIATVLQRDFLKPGGLVTSLHVSGQQWDAPNGWPPHQWMAYVGLRRYGHAVLAEQIRTRWMALNRQVFKSTGKMMEKYNVVNIQLESGGGEYPAQDGFGWTNGVYRAFMSEKSMVPFLD